MTVKILAGEAAVQTPVPLETKPVRDEAQERETAPERVSEKPVVYVPQETEYLPRGTARRRRKTLSFGDIVFVQLIVSVLLAASLWAGSTFGTEEIRTVCERVTELLR